MEIRKLTISGFRGVKSAEVHFAQHCVVIGPNGCGKSTIIDALTLLLGRPRMVRALTEHDFYGATPAPNDRIRLIATIAGFPSPEPERNSNWFRAGRAIPKWIDRTFDVAAEPREGADLCAEIGFAARFDHEDLSVETVRYFHDADGDPFDDGVVVEQVPARLVSDLGFFVLPARRGWEGVASFASDLFRRTISSAAGLPSSEILHQRDQLRAPDKPIEDSLALRELVASMNERLGRLMTEKPAFKLRVTAGDTESVLQALLPHYQEHSVTLPASRHGAGLLSLQAFILLLEVGRLRTAKKLPYILAMEEPELHLAPGLHTRLIADAIDVADQTICTTHSPRVASQYQPTDMLVVRRSQGSLQARRLLNAPLPLNASNNERRLYQQNLARYVEALMHPRVLVPEGRYDCEWLARLANAAESRQTAPPFSSVLGIAPTENAAVRDMAKTIARLRSGIIALVDGDPPGDGYVRQLAEDPAAVEAVVQWPAGWTIEDVIGWIVEAGGDAVIEAIDGALEGRWRIGNVARLVEVLKQGGSGTPGLKQDLVAHDAIVGCLNDACHRRAADVLDAFVAVAMGLAHPRISVAGASPIVARFVT